MRSVVYVRRRGSLPPPRVHRSDPLLANVLPMFGVQVISEDITHGLVAAAYIGLRGWWTGHRTFGSTMLK